MALNVISIEMTHTEEICSQLARLPWHHEAGDDSVPVRNTLFTVCKQLSIHQRQRHSVALVTAQRPTPSYVIQQDLMGQMCVINGTWVHRGVCDEFAPLMSFTSFPRQRCIKTNRRTEEYGGERKRCERGVVKTKKEKSKKVKQLALCAVAYHLIMRRGPGATSHVSQQRMMENGWRLHPGPQPFLRPSCQCSTRVVAASDGSVDGSALMGVSIQSKQTAESLEPVTFRLVASLEVLNTAEQ